MATANPNRNTVSPAQEGQPDANCYAYNHNCSDDAGCSLQKCVEVRNNRHGRILHASLPRLQFASNSTVTDWLVKLLAALLFTISVSFAQSSQGADRLSIIVIDGDTFALPNGERIRIMDMDAPESFRSHCEEELIAGLAAKARLAALLRLGPLTVRREGKDWFGRTLARVFINGQSVGQTLIEEGLALPYTRGKKAHARRTAHWCRRAKR